MKNLNSTDYQVLERIRIDSKISRTDLSIFFNLTPAAISKIIKKLISYNLIVESHSLQSTGGRPKKTLKINSGYKKIIGINLGPEFIEVAIGQLDGKLLEADKKYFTYKTQAKVVELLFQEISKMLNQ
jgi:N-acetylglucosamine repressor